MKTTRVHFSRIEDGRLQVSALVTEQDDAAIHDDSWNTVMQCVKLMNEQPSTNLCLDRDSWDTAYWA